MSQHEKDWSLNKQATDSTANTPRGTPTNLAGWGEQLLSWVKLAVMAWWAASWLTVQPANVCRRWVRSGSAAQQALPGRVLTHPDAKPEERQSDAVRHAHGRQEPDFGRRGALVLDVANDLLGGLPLVHLSLDPLVKTAFLQGAIEADQELNVAVEAGLREGGQVAQHVVPLAPADPVGVEASVEPVETVLGVHQQSQRSLRGSLTTTSDHTPPGQLLKLHRHHSAGAVLFNVLLETLNTHVERLLEETET